MVLMGRNSEESMSCKGGEGIRGGAHKKKRSEVVSLWERCSGQEPVKTLAKEGQERS